MDTLTITYADELPSQGRTVGTEIEVTQYGGYNAQKPYKNGVVVYTNSGWAGNGFGNYVNKVAIRDGVAVATYVSSVFPSKMEAWVLGTEIYADSEMMRICGKLERRVTKAAFHKWIAAVKAL